MRQRSEGALKRLSIRKSMEYFHSGIGSDGYFEFRGLLHVLSVIGGMRLRASQLARSSAPWHLQFVDLA